MISKPRLLTERIATTFILLFGVAATIVAQPAYVNYQGRLNDAAGQPLPTGSYTLEFNIYNHPTGTDPTNRVWGPFIFDGAVGDGHGASASVINGRFNVILGPADTTTRSIRSAFDAENRYLEIKINNGAPILPRQQFLSTPYAFKAQGIIGSLDISGNMVVSSNITVGNDLRISGAVQGDVNVQGSVAVNGQVTSTVSGVPFYMVPRGAVIMWSGSVVNIPAGWALCNGSNGTPDLRNRFVLGYDAVGTIGMTGGTNQHNHTVNIPAFDSGPGIGTALTGNGGGNGTGTHHHTINPDIIATSTTTFLPPYMMLAYIMKL